MRLSVDLAGDDELIAIDWQRPTYYRYSPRQQVGVNAGYAISVFPDGDYCAHLTADLAWRDFRPSLAADPRLWGDELVATLGADLVLWLPTHAQSRV